MSYQPRHDHISPPEKFSIGPTSAFFENVRAGFQRQYVLDSAIGLQFELQDRLNESIDIAGKISGRDVSAGIGNSILGLSAWLEREQGGDPYNTGVIPVPLLRKYLSDLDELDTQLTELSRTDINAPQQPESGIKSLRQIYAEEVNRRKELISELDYIGERATWFGNIVGGGLGGIAGSFSIRDPVLLGSVLVPIGAGRSLAQKMLLEALLGASAEGLQQSAFVLPRQRALGEPESNLLASILFASIGSAALRGAVEGAAIPAFRALERKLFPQRVADRAKMEALSKILKSFDPEQARSPAELSALQEAIRRLSPNSETRAAEATLGVDLASQRLSPYPENRAGRLQTEAELLREQIEFEGLAASDTAVGRIPDSGATPTAILSRAPEETLARTERPELYTRLDELQTSVDETSAQVAELEERLSSRSLGDAIGEIDEDLGVRVKSVEQELRQQPELPAARKRELEQELDNIVHTVGYGKIDRAEVQATAPVKQELRELKRGLRQQRQELKGVQDEINSVLDDYRLIPDEPVESLATPVGSVVDSLAETADPELQRTVVERTLRSAGAATEEGAPPTPQTGEEGIDVGLEQTVDPKTAVPGEEGIRSAREVAEEIADEEALARAAVECGL